MKVLNIAGARPNFMKIAPLVRAMDAREGIETCIIHTGQHYDESMSSIFFRELGIPHPKTNLEVGSGERLEQIERIMAEFEPVMEQERPNAVLVVGDVNSTIACARIAVQHDCPVVHVEAGLRSFDREMPEEVNRVETDGVSDYLFVTEQSGMDNLVREAVPGKAYLVGNVMIDTLVQHLDQSRAAGIQALHGLREGKYFVGTFHRPSNVDTTSSLINVISIIEYAAAKHPIVLPLHPRTRNSLIRLGLLDRVTNNPGVRVIEPLGYLDFIALVSQARCVVTDSGGIQEETTYMQVPCITMRDNTERPVTVEVGSNILAGTQPDGVVSAIDSVLDGSARKGAVPELWDGRAAERIVATLVAELAG